MRFSYPNFASCIKRGLLLVGTISPLAMLSSVAVYADAMSEAQQPGSHSCAAGPLTSDSYLYKGVKHLVLTMELPWGWQEAWDCHGHEDKCAANNPEKRTQTDRAAYVEGLRKAYQPHVALTPNELKNIYSLAVKQLLLPRLPVDDSCHAPDFAIKEASRKYEPGTFVIHVQLDLEPGAASGEVVSLRTVGYRPDLPEAAIERLLRPYIGDITPISLKWPDSQVSAMVSGHVHLFFMNLP